jgi:4'-phosphopantetheinyl transferase
MTVGVQSGLSFQLHEFVDSVDFSPACSLREDEVHVWQVRLGASSAQVSHLDQLLSNDEKQRVERFRHEQRRNEFIIGRGTLRVLLGSYLGVPAEELRFAYSAHGKPGLAAPRGREVDFNVSHAEGLALFAFAVNRKIGVDIERVRQDIEVEEIARRFFSPAEQLALCNLPAQERPQAFFRCWTRKEAYIKARGEGLSHPLHQFDVSLAPGESAALLSTRPDRVEAGRWLLHGLSVTSGYAAAVAVEADSVVLV